MSDALPDYDQALRLALGAVDARVASRRTDETIDATLRALGRVLSHPIIADRELPPFHRAMMDGYALRAADVAPGRASPVVGEIPAGAAGDVHVPPGACVKIATGAPLPADCDTVIQHELSDRCDPVRFTVGAIEQGHAVHPRGADARQGDQLIAAGTIICPHHLGIAASVGVGSINVRSQPRTCVLTSGDEVVASDTPTAAIHPHQIRNSNSVMIRALLSRMGAETSSAPHLPDEAAPTIDAVRQAIADHDLVVTVGGVSAGERDHFPAAFDACGIEHMLTGAAIQPGRPIVVGRSPAGTVVVALPGNPVSALACACLFIWPIVRAMLGLEPTLPWRAVELASEVKPNPHRRAFRPAILQHDGRVIVPAWAGSGDLAHTAPTHGLVELPIQRESVPAGTSLRFLNWP